MDLNNSLLTVTLSTGTMRGMTESFTLSELAAAVNTWSDKHGVVPANGQAAGQLSERSIRFYRTIGLVDGPMMADGRGGYGEKHRLQLIALRLLQAQGLPLRRIRDLLYGRSVKELREIERRGLTTHSAARQASRPVIGSTQSESWSIMPLDEEFLIVSRLGRPLPVSLLEALRQLLSAAPRAG
jgi:DNA-binding transcriptional MerR regulator